jgi:TonB family protein
VKREDLYENDSLIQGTCSDSKGEKETYYDYFIPASFPNGKVEMIKFLTKELQYPEDAITYGVEGKVFVRFTVKRNGVISEAEVIRKVDDLLDSEALRIVQKMPKWIPGMVDGEIVNMYFDLPVRFKLE